MCGAYNSKKHFQLRRNLKTREHLPAHFHRLPTNLRQHDDVYNIIDYLKMAHIIAIVLGQLVLVYA